MNEPWRITFRKIAEHMPLPLLVKLRVDLGKVEGRGLLMAKMLMPEAEFAIARKEADLKKWAFLPDELAMIDDTN